MRAYYNEIDPFAAQVLRELIADGEIAPGVVDERSIEDVRPDELSRFTQCHFFAGAGVWSYALRRAGWPDDRPIWTGSCPCQPFSQAGKGGGFDDKRHLWPTWQWLIEQCEPECVAGEQVADKGADAWLDLVQADLEGMGYAFGCVPLASAGFGAPNPRHRSFWVAHAAGLRLSGFGRGGEAGAPEYRDAGGLGHADCEHARRDCGASVGSEGWPVVRAECHAYRAPSAASGLADASRLGRREGGERGVEAGSDGAGQRGAADRLEYGGFLSEFTTTPSIYDGISDAERSRWERAVGLADPVRTGRPERRTSAGSGQATGSGGASNRAPGPVNGFWADADWLYCRDPRGPRWRPVNSGAFPLAPSAPGRVGTLRISGNAINAEVATGFIEAVIAHLNGAPPTPVSSHTAQHGEV